MDDLEQGKSEGFDSCDQPSSDFDRSASCVFYAKKITKDASLLKCWGPRDASYSSTWNTFIIISLYTFANILPEVIFLKFIQCTIFANMYSTENSLKTHPTQFSLKPENLTALILVNVFPTAISTGDRHEVIGSSCQLRLWWAPQCKLNHFLLKVH